MPFLRVIAIALLSLAASSLSANATPASSDAPIRILDFSLQGNIVAGPNPTRALVSLNNRANEKVVWRLVVTVKVKLSTTWVIQSQSTTTVTLGPSETRAVEIPAWISTSHRTPPDRFLLTVAVLDERGKNLGEDQREGEATGGDDLVVLYCHPVSVCKQVHNDILFSGTVVEQAAKINRLKFLLLQDPPRAGWGYNGTGAVLLAQSVDAWEETQRTALEDYVRAGGRLLIVEPHARDRGFLSAYRQGPVDAADRIVGVGSLKRLADRGEAGLASQTETPADILKPASDFWLAGAEGYYFFKRKATNFAVPSLTWLMIWLAVYALLVGPVSYFVLQKFGRREWGWLSAPAIAVTIALLIFVVSYRKRPKLLTVDRITTYTMDSVGARAAGSGQLRIWSPNQQDVYASLDTPWLPNSNLTYGDQSAPRKKSPSDFELQLNPPMKLRLPMRTWAVRDENTSGMHTFDGTVTASDAGVFHNQTALAFDDSIYVTSSNVYLLGQIAPGAKIDLSIAKSELLRQYVGRQINEYPRHWTIPARTSETTDRDREEWRQTIDSPFQLVELIRGWPADAGSRMKHFRGIFYGVASAPSVPFEISDQKVTVKDSVLVKVIVLAEK